MGKPSQKKAKRREKRDAKNEQRRTDRRGRLAVPKFRVRNLDRASATVVDAVTDIVRTLTTHTRFDAVDLRELEKAKRFGFHKTKDGALTWSVKIGEAVFQELSKRLSNSLMRRIDVEVICQPLRPGCMDVNIRSLKQIKKNILCSPKLPKVSLDTESPIVSFLFHDDDHFIRRIEERTVVHADNYLTKGQLFSYLYRWKHFDLVQLPSGQKALKLWNWCDPSLFLGELWMELLGPSAEAIIHPGAKVPFIVRGEQIAHYLVGYCPFDNDDIQDGFVVLKTLLLPGMDNTPEVQPLMNSLPNYQARRDVHAKISEQTMKTLFETRDYGLFRRLHNFVPQVKFLDQSVFSFSK